MGWGFCANIIFQVLVLEGWLAQNNGTLLNERIHVIKITLPDPCTLTTEKWLIQNNLVVVV